MQSTIIISIFSTELFCPPDPPPRHPLLFFSSQKQKQKQGRCAILASRHHCRPLSTIKHIATYLQLPLSHHLHPTYSILSHYIFYPVKRSIVTSDKGIYHTHQLNQYRYKHHAALHSDRRPLRRPHCLPKPHPDPGPSTLRPNMYQQHVRQGIELRMRNIRLYVPL